MKRMILTICSILFLLIGGCATEPVKPPTTKAERMEQLNDLFYGKSGRMLFHKTYIYND